MLHRHTQTVLKPNVSSTRNDCLAKAAPPTQCELPSCILELAPSNSPGTKNATPTAYISLLDSESENKRDDDHIDDIDTHNEDAFTSKRKSANNKATKKRQSFMVKCLASGLCKESFNSLDAMAYHVKEYHAKGLTKKFECHLCQKSFMNKFSVRCHVDSVHTGLQPFKCPNKWCSKSFSQKGGLKTHINSVHLGIKRFKCSNHPCTKRFAQKVDMKRHIDSVHRGLKPFTCPNRLCSRGFSDKSNLKRHINSKHVNPNWTVFKTSII